MGLCLVMSISNLQAQTNYADQLKKMKAEDAKIEKFINSNLRNTPQSEVNAFIKKLVPNEDHPNKYTDSEKASLVKTFKRGYWKRKYFERYPAARDIYRPPFDGCHNGNFETGSAATYLLESDNAIEGDGYTGGHCDFDPTILPYVPEMYGSNFDNFRIVDNTGADPVVGIDRVNSGTYAMRINKFDPLENPFSNNPDPECLPEHGVNKLSKQLVLTSTNQDLTFYYALVLEDANHVSSEKQPMFIAMARDENGNVLDQFCQVALSSNPFLNEVTNPNTYGCGFNSVMYKDWDCTSLEVEGEVGDTVTLEIYVTDCGAGAHFGYAYVDDICEECVQDTCNTTGWLDLNNTDPCFDTTGFFTISGSYLTPAINCDEADFESLTAVVYHNGTPTTLSLDASQINVNTDNETFTITLSVDDFPNTSGPFDFEVQMLFDLNGFPITVNDFNTNAGEDNDVQFDCVPVCCRSLDNYIWNGNFNNANGSITSDYEQQSTIDVASVVPGEYAITSGTLGQTISPTWSTGCGDNNHLFINGQTGGTGSAEVYSITVPVSEGRYSFCVQLKNLPQCGFDVKPNVDITFSVSGYDLSDIVVDQPEGDCDWLLVNQIIDVPGGTSSLTISILLDETGEGDGNDLAIDNLLLYELEPVPASQVLFNITPVLVDANTYNFEAEPLVGMPRNCQYSWSVAELDSDLDDIPSTVVDNPIQWQTYPNSLWFEGYDGTSTLSGTDPGEFSLSKSYRITYARWCDCDLPNSFTYQAIPGRSKGAPPTIKSIGARHTSSTSKDSRSEQELGTGGVDNSSLIHVYPSPTDRLVHVDASRVSRPHIQIIDQNGRVIQTISDSKSEVDIDVTSLASGIYSVKVIDGYSGESFNQKFIKE